VPDELKTGFRVHVTAPDGSPHYTMDDALGFADVTVGRDGVPQVRHNAAGLADALSLASAVLAAMVLAPMLQRAVREELKRVADAVREGQKTGGEA